MARKTQKDDDLQKIGKPQLRELVCRLDEKERDERARQAAALREQHRLQEATEKARKAEAKTRLDGLKEQAAKLEAAANSGEETREVPVQQYKDLALNEMRWVRVDTEAVVEKRRLEDHEKQRDLPLRERAKPATEKAPKVDEPPAASTPEEGWP